MRTRAVSGAIAILVIGVVGKYVEHQDAYKSIYEALKHGGIANDAKVEIRKIDAEEIVAHGPEKYLKEVDLVQPGLATIVNRASRWPGASSEQR